MTAEPKARGAVWTPSSPPSPPQAPVFGDEGRQRLKSAPEARKITLRVRLRRDRSLIIMTLPAVILLLVFGYAPMLGLVMAFQQYNTYNGFLYSSWVGFANFEQLFGDP